MNEDEHETNLQSLVRHKTTC